VARLLGYRAFVNKLWNASRFALMNLEGDIDRDYEFASLPLPSRWVLSRLQTVAERVGEHLEAFRFDLAANELYHFVWNEFCDWYIEAAKPLLRDEAEAPVARGVLIECLDAILRLLHPIVPHVTEEIWQRLPHEGASIMVAPFPVSNASRRDAGAEAGMGRLMDLVTEIRRVRSTYEVEPRRRIDVTIVAPDAADRAFVERHGQFVRELARLEGFEVVAEAAETPRTIRQPVGALELRVPMAGLFDIAAEKTRLTKERLKIQKELEGLQRRLDNPKFIEKANPDVVQEHQGRLSSLAERLERLAATLRELAAG
jgi:valyl-tRNA synthetase